MLADLDIRWQLKSVSQTTINAWNTARRWLKRSIYGQGAKLMSDKTRKTPKLLVSAKTATVAVTNQSAANLQCRRHALVSAAVSACLE